MALRKEIETGSGAVATYWRIAGIRIAIAGYVDEAKRRAGKDALANAHVDVPAEELRAMLPALYERLRRQKEFAEAEDVIVSRPVEVERA